MNGIEEMCSIPIKEDMILFETGTYSFSGEPMFNISLVRQFPNDEEEMKLKLLKEIKNNNI